ncbi:MAG: CTP synthase, partial [Oscillospiraceae bacterium]
SITESLKHAGIENDVLMNINLIRAEELTDENTKDKLAGCHGILVPGGFGDRGIDGKISAIRYARENNVPFLGICLGMQMAVVEFARNVANLPDSNSTEFNETCENPIIHIMEEQKEIINKGGTMRLGLYPCKLQEDSKSFKLYQDVLIYERHRHRYEFNNRYRELFLSLGMNIVGTSPDDKLVEIVEYTNHPFFVAAQFHPEFKSRPNRAHPLFKGFISSAITNSQSK